MPDITPVIVDESGRRIVPSRSLAGLWQQQPTWSRSRLYHPTDPAEGHLSLAMAMRALSSAAQPAPPGLVPVTYVDDRSLACVVCTPEGGEPSGAEGSVVRWHLDNIPVAHQKQMVDIDAWEYLLSLADESRQLDVGFKGMLELADEYHENFTDRSRKPKSKDLRPFQLACQNVIIAMAAMRYDDRIDGHQVHQWLACDVPHVATNEGLRALSVLTLCDAYQAGGTMEIDFRRHPEGRIPAALRRFGRTLGVRLGDELGPKRISPAEARQLFLAVTPMPAELQVRAEETIGTGYLSAESLCFALLSPIWRPLELDFLLACSSRVEGLLTGDTPVTARPARSAEMELGRAAVMAYTLWRRLDSKDTVGSPSGSRVFDDTSHGVRWSVLPEYGALVFENVPPDDVPWRTRSTSTPPIGPNGRLTVLPRPHPLPDDQEALQLLRRTGDAADPVVIVAPAGSGCPGGGADFIEYPGDVGDLDDAVLGKLRSARRARA